MAAPFIIGLTRPVTESRLDVRNAFDSTLVDTLSVATVADVDEAVAAAKIASKQPFPVHERVSALYAAADNLENHAAEVALLLAREGSKTIREAQREPVRAAEVLRMAAEVARTMAG